MHRRHLLASLASIAAAVALATAPAMAQGWPDKAVRIQRGGDVIHGQGLVAAEDFSKYSVRRITGTLRIASDDTLAAQ